MLPLLAATFILAGCATIAPPRIGQPWLREDERAPGLPAGASVHVTVSGQRDALPGHPDFANDEITDRVAASLERRGYKIVDDGADYEVGLTYQTVRHDFDAVLTEFKSRNSSRNYYTSTSRGQSSPSVAIAALVSTIASASSQSTEMSQRSEPGHYFSHSAAIDARGRDGALVWQVETAWESRAIDISDGIGSFLARATSSLPRDPNHLVEVPKLAPKKTGGFYRTYCRGEWFSCPALPYRIRFAPTANMESADRVENGNWNKSASTTKSADWLALPAYIDLITHAEDALPAVKSIEKSDVLANETWSRVTLASRYLLGPNRTPANVMVHLMATPTSYVITNCNVVSDAQYNEYLADLARWRARVDEFWDFYEK
jgi:hypothetical protein